MTQCEIYMDRIMRQVELRMLGYNSEEEARLGRPILALQRFVDEQEFLHLIGMDK